ncbi:hypothetical protein BDR03DRAFT_954077, partial [Suillus americanus]
SPSMIISLLTPPGPIIHRHRSSRRDLGENWQYIYSYRRHDSGRQVIRMAALYTVC